MDQPSNLRSGAVSAEPPADRELALFKKKARDWNAEADRYLAQRDELLVALQALTEHMDREGCDGYGMPKCPWCKFQSDDKEHAGDCELLKARELLAALRAESREPGDLSAVANSRLYDLATAEFQHLLDPNAGLDVTERDRREMQRGSRRPWPAIAESIRRLEDGLVIDGVILVKGTYEVTLDVQGRIVAHHRVRAESRETPDQS